MTTLLISLLALTHTSNIQAYEGGADVLVALTVAINDAAKEASENLNDQEITDLKNCANNNFSGDDCQDRKKHNNTSQHPFFPIRGDPVSPTCHT